MTAITAMYEARQDEAERAAYAADLRSYQVPPSGVTLTEHVECCWAERDRQQRRAEFCRARRLSRERMGL